MIIRRLLNSKYNYVYGLLSFIIYSLSFLIGPDEQSAHHVLMPIKALLILISGLMFILSCNENCSSRIKISYSILSLVIMVYEVLLFVAVGRTILYIRDYPAILNSLVWYLCSLSGFVRFGKWFVFFFKGILRSKETLILIASSLIMALVVIILSAEPTGFRFSWDSDTLYGFIYSLDYDSLYDACSLMFMQVHVSVIYVYLLVLFKLLFGSVRTAFFIVNSMCIITASFGMTFLYKELSPTPPIGKSALSDISSPIPYSCYLRGYVGCRHTASTTSTYTAYFHF